VRYWDKAGTEDGGAYTAGVLIEEQLNGRWCISDVRRGQWSALERETRILQTTKIDNADRRVEVWVEQEPGSGGKESAERTIQMLRGYVAKPDRVTGDKETRAEPYAAQVQAGNVDLVIAEWNRDFMDEHEVFPNGKYKDQVDAAAGGFMKISGRFGPAVVGPVKGLY
jgi:predicted phage terminase large subunit-like protein